MRYYNIHYKSQARYCMPYYFTIFVERINEVEINEEMTIAAIERYINRLEYQERLSGDYIDERI